MTSLHFPRSRFPTARDLLYLVLCVSLVMSTFCLGLCVCVWVSLFKSVQPIQAYNRSETQIVCAQDAVSKFACYFIYTRYAPTSKRFRRNRRKKKKDNNAQRTMPFEIRIKTICCYVDPCLLVLFYFFVLQSNIIGLGHTRILLCHAISI